MPGTVDAAVSDWDAPRKSIQQPRDSSLPSLPWMQRMMRNLSCTSLLAAFVRLAIQPIDARRFGGSDGFGQRPTSDAMAWPPEPQWCVALVSDPQACEGALRAGMRVIGLPPDDDQAVDPALEGVADVCLDTLTDIQSLDDLSTPGAFWLNPCMHRDGEGYAVNPQSGRRYDQAAGAGGGETSSASAAVDDDPEDAAAAAILRDMGL